MIKQLSDIQKHTKKIQSKTKNSLNKFSCLGQQHVLIHNQCCFYCHLLTNASMAMGFCWARNGSNYISKTLNAQVVAPNSFESELSTKDSLSVIFHFPPIFIKHQRIHLQRWLFREQRPFIRWCFTFREKRQQLINKLKLTAATPFSSPITPPGRGLFLSLPRRYCGRPPLPFTYSFYLFIF